MKKFTFKSKDPQGEATIIFHGDDLEEIVAEFEKFLRATGFDLGNSKFALIDFNEMEMYDDGAEGLFEDDDDKDKGSGGGSGNTNH